MNLCLRRNLLRPSLKNILRSATTTPEIDTSDQVVIVDDTEDTLARELEIEKKRNISRLAPAHFNVMNNRRPYEEPKIIAHLTVKYNRKMYGKYGITSGVNPSICWPSKTDIQEIQEYEAVAFPYSIPDMMHAAAQKRKDEILRIAQRDKEVAAKFEKLDQWKKELNAKIAKKAAEVEAVKQKKERLIEEVRRHFGFKLDPKDERFQEMLAKKEKEQKKKEKLARQEAKEKIMFAKLQQQNADSENASKKSN
ncbi:growth arrest and DNA damage-inducible proteins-interacting protein 1 [Leptidea sinapis]|uniref:growth arrest and DNA damage-inducible proteins-interacting protein 1 n=1 Tax=Leptidea sinapis TaxID=189913 RepID=UPI00214202A9|nr:growth arrest and DNA damage-inducible proteins-interacting protein 1 [Leptidea sinapis]